jgi:hypothetical protein
MTATNTRDLHRPVLWKACLLFALVSGLLIAADQLSMRYGLDGSQRIVDDILGGVIAGAIFHLYERRRLQRLRERLQVIDLMNHHIRNALQPLMLVTYKSESSAQIRIVEDCARRIDWTLREILPGNSTERFVIPDSPPVERSRLAADPPPALSSPEGENCVPKPVNSWSKPFFSHWLYAWRNRNEVLRH